MKKYTSSLKPKGGKWTKHPFLLGRQGAEFDPFKGGEKRGSGSATVESGSVTKTKKG